jgi:sortase A
MNYMPPLKKNIKKTRKRLPTSHPAGKKQAQPVFTMAEITPTTKPEEPKTASPTVTSAPEVQPKIKMAKKKSKTILAIASLVLIVVGLFFLVYPFWPSIQFALFPPKQIAANSLNQTVNVNDAASLADTTGHLPQSHKIVPLGNILIIPKIGVEMKIVEGDNETVALNQGAWHLPGTSTPDLGGNTVITGHRFKYRPPSKETFYLLDKLAVGDEILVNWEGLQYSYTVSETKVVEPTAIEVAYNTDTPQVTLITCTPLFTTKQRLVVVAKPGL